MQNLITFAVAFADNLMVGSLSEYAISGVYMGNQLQTLLQMFTGGVDGALLILAAQYWGKRDTDSIRRIVAIGCRFGVIIAFILTLAAAIFPRQIISLFTPDVLIIDQAADYMQYVCYSYVFFALSQLLISSMRSIGIVKIGLYVSLAALLVNVGLNYILIFGKLGFPAMGVKGAAIATLTARITELIVIVLFISFKDKTLNLRIRDMLLRSKALTGDFFRYGLPIIGGSLIWSVNMMVQSGIIGRLGADAVASVSVAGMLNNLVFLFVSGLTSAVSIITGKTIGAGEYEIMKTYAKTIQLIFMGLGLIGGVFVLLIKDLFISFYSLGDAAAVAGQFIVVIAIVLPGRCYQATCLAGLVKAGGDTAFVFKNDTIFVLGVVLPAGLTAMNVFHAPAWVVYACLQSDQILKCFVAFVKINSFNWMKNLTKSKEEAAVVLNTE
jgi:putative MATE family efflux protein